MSSIGRFTLFAREHASDEVVFSRIPKDSMQSLYFCGPAGTGPTAYPPRAMRRLRSNRPAQRGMDAPAIARLAKTKKRTRTHVANILTNESIDPPPRGHNNYLRSTFSAKHSG